jgi:hypothetical protein
MTRQEKVRKLTGSPLWASQPEAARLAESMSGPDILAIVKLVAKRINDQDEMIANRLARLSAGERDAWIETWQTPELPRPQEP